MKKDNLIKNQNLFPRTTDIPQAHLNIYLKKTEEISIKHEWRTL